MSVHELRTVLFKLKEGETPQGRVLDQLEANGYVRSGRLTRNGKKLIEREERLQHLKKPEKVQEFKEITPEEFLEDEDN